MKGVGACAFACLVAAQLALTPSPAAGQARTALSWVREPGAERCIAAPELGTLVERLVGPVLVAASSAEVSIEGRIALRGRRFVAAIVVSDARGAVLGEREVQGAEARAGASADCRALDDQLAFVIAVAIDPNAALAELPGDFAPEGDPGAELLAELEANPPRPAAPRSPRPVPPAPVERAEEPDEPWHASFAAGAGSRAGALPELGATVQLEAGAGVGWLTQRAHIAFSPPETVRAGGAEIELSWLDLGTSGCAALARGSPEVELCAGVAGVHLAAEGRRLVAAKPRERWLFGPRLGVRVAWPLLAGLRLVLDASAHSVFPKHRIGYASNAVEVVYRVPPVTGAGAVLLELSALP